MKNVFIVCFLFFSFNVYAQIVKIDKSTFSVPLVVTIKELKNQIDNIDNSNARLQEEIDSNNKIRVNLINQLKSASTVGVTDADAVPGVK